MEACSRCGEPRDMSGQRYCRLCHNAYMRAWRAAGREQRTEEHRRRSNVRAYANVYQGRGHLIPRPCESCGSDEDVEKHHENYRRPLLVRWLCRTCHGKLPKEQLVQPGRYERIHLQF